MFASLSRSLFAHKPRILSNHRRLTPRPQVEELEARRLMSVFLVTNNTDADYPKDGSYHGVGSLRQALIAANLNPGPDTIQFDLTQDQLTITPATSLPTIADSVIIDGSSQPGWRGFYPPVSLAGPGQGNNLNGLTVNAPDCTVEALQFTAFDDAIAVLSDNNTIKDCWAFNSYYGIEIQDGASGNQIGGTQSSDRNYCSGDLRGIKVDGVNNLIEGNEFSSNTQAGIEVRTGSGNTIGGTTPAAANHILTNSGAGILLGSGASANLIEGNRIANNGQGIELDGALNNTIGGTAGAAGNTIIGNSGAGIQIGPDLEGHPSSANVIQGNFIGVLPTANGEVAIPNHGPGVLIAGGSSNNTIGGTALGAGNVIAFNAAGQQQTDGPGIPVPGVAVTDTGSTGNAILGNSIHDNSGPSIDLGNDGVTTNDSQGHGGPNNFQDFPVLTSATLSPTGLMVTGTLRGAANQTVTVQFFASDTADANGFGPGQTFLGSNPVTTDAAGNAAFTATVHAPSGEFVVSATATAPDGSTSEFAQDLTLLAVSQTAAPLLVNLGDQVTYSITVTNNQAGPVALVLTDTLPATSTFVSATLNGTPIRLFAFGQTITLHIPLAHPGDSATLAITVTMDSVDKVTSQTTGLNTNIASVRVSSSGVPVTGVSAATATVRLTPNQAFVAQLYLDLLHRPADTGGLLYWSNQLDTQPLDPATRLSRAQVAQAIEGGNEYRGAVVRSLYLKVLHRPAAFDRSHQVDDVGFWLAKLKESFAFTETLEAALLGSPEYFTQRGGGSVGGFLAAVYQDVLNRPIDASGARFWAGPLEKFLTTRAAVALAVLNSPLEGIPDQVQANFQQFLGRAADPGGLAGFSASLQAGETDETVIAALIGSDEYFRNLGKR